MHCHGVGASAKEITVLPTRSCHWKAGRGSRLSRKKPFRLHTSAKVDDDAPRPVREVETPHEPAEADLDVPVEHAPDSCPCRRRRRKAR